jgi:predicted small metal-binding protein
MVMKALVCRNAGFDCDTMIRADTEDEIITYAGEHTIKEHNMKPEDITPQFKEKIKNLITNSLSLIYIP